MWCWHPQRSPWVDAAVIAVNVWLLASAAAAGWGASRAGSAHPSTVPPTRLARCVGALFAAQALFTAGTSIVAHMSRASDLARPLVALGSGPVLGLASHLARATAFASVATLCLVFPRQLAGSHRAAASAAAASAVGAAWAAFVVAQVVGCGADVFAAPSAAAPPWTTVSAPKLWHDPVIVGVAVAEPGLSVLSGIALVAAIVRAHRWCNSAASAVTYSLLDAASDRGDIGGESSGGAAEPAFPSRDDGRGPEDAAWLPSRLVVAWMGPMLRKGATRQLDAGDLPPLSARDAPEAAETRIGRELDSERLRRRPSLTRLLARVFGAEFARAGLWRGANDALGLVAPLLLRAVVEAAEGRRGGPLAAAPLPQPGSSTADTRATAVAEWGVLLVASVAAQAVTGPQFDLAQRRLAMRLRSGLVPALFSAAMQPVSCPGGGTMVNLATVDVEKLMTACGSLHELWSLPAQVAVTLVLLHQQVGPAFLAGVAVLAVMVPVNLAIARRIGALSERMMRCKDARVDATAAVLRHARAVRFAGLTPVAAARVQEARKLEVSVLASRKYLDALCVLFWACTPVAVAFATFATYAVAGGAGGKPLSAGAAFAALALLRTLIHVMNAFPWVLTGLMEARVSLHRLASALLHWPRRWAVELRPAQPAREARIVARAKGSFAFLASDPCLHNIDLSVPHGAYVAVVGSVGSGKSALLRALMGHMCAVGDDAPPDEAGIVGDAAYAPQTPWVARGTIRDNVCNGSGGWESPHAVRQALWAACFLDDVQRMPAGDLQEVGDAGATLSGGQRQRLGLARALYHEGAAITIMDSPTSALDGATARRVFNRAIGSRGVLAGRTRVVATHAAHLITDADVVVVVDNGSIVERGSPQELAARDNGHFAALLRASQGQDREDDDDEEEEEEEEEGADAILNTGELSRADESEGVDLDRPPTAEGAGALGSEEDRVSGAVSGAVVRVVAGAMGWSVASIVIIALLGMQGTRNGCDWWVSAWTGGNVSGGVPHFLRVYGVLAATNAVITAVRAFVFAFACLRAARRMHDSLVDSVFAAPLAFFDTTPVGRLLNRFSGDVLAVDEDLPFQLNIFLAQSVGLLGTVIVIAIAVPPLLAMVPPLAVAYRAQQRLYRASAREVRRLDAVTRSPLLAGFEAVASGQDVLSVAGAAAAADHKARHRSALEPAQRALFAGFAAAQWLSARLQGMGACVVAGLVAVAAIEIAAGGALSPSLLGLALAYALPIVGGLSGLLSSAAETEKQLVAAERVSEYFSVGESELVPHGDRSRLHASDGDAEEGGGSVLLQGVVARHRPELPPALSVASLVITGGEWTAVCGRTGSGKSTLLAVIARMIPFEGTITVGGHAAVGGVAGDAWRQHAVLCLPQSPFLIAGSVADNVDPEGATSREDAEAALIAVGATDLDPDRRVEPNATDLSAGQRQRLCLARAAAAIAARPACRVVLLPYCRI